MSRKGTPNHNVSFNVFQRFSGVTTDETFFGVRQTYLDNFYK